MLTSLASPSKKSIPLKRPRPIGGDMGFFDDLESERAIEEVEHIINFAEDKSIVREAKDTLWVAAETKQEIWQAVEAQNIEEEASQNKFRGTIEFTVFREKAVVPDLKPNLDAAKEAAAQTSQRVGEEAKTIFSALWELFTNYVVSPDFKDKIKGFLGKFKKPKKEDPEAAKKKIESAHTKAFQQNLEAEKNRTLSSKQEDLFRMALRMDVTVEEAARLSGHDHLRKEHFENVALIVGAATKKSEKIKEQEKAKKEQNIKETGGRGPDLSLNKVAEGGSILSTTGGAGAG